MIIENYSKACLQVSDINGNLPILQLFASQCNHITEFGTRYLISSWALMAGLLGVKGTLVSVDIEHPKKYGLSVKKIVKEAKKEGVDFQFVLGDTLSLKIEKTDFLFIDTTHTGKHLTKELKRHASRVRKFIGFHDTESCKEELLPVIEKFLKNNKKWRKVIDVQNNNGLIIIMKI